MPVLVLVLVAVVPWAMGSVGTCAACSWANVHRVLMLKSITITIEIQRSSEAQTDAQICFLPGLCALALFCARLSSVRLSRRECMSPPR